MTLSPALRGNGSPRNALVTTGDSEFLPSNFVRVWIGQLDVVAMWDDAVPGISFDEGSSNAALKPSTYGFEHVIDLKPVGSGVWFAGNARGVCFETIAPDVFSAGALIADLITGAVSFDNVVDAAFIDGSGGALFILFGTVSP